jgi:DNA-binding response OmpR family regulator
VSREYLESHIWGERSPDKDILRSHMHLLRKEVDGEGARKILHTVFGQGYSIRVQDGE